MERSLNIYQEKAPIFTFSKSNVIDGQFAYSYPSSRVQANQIRVSWNDPDDHYKQNVELVEDTQNIAKQEELLKKKLLLMVVLHKHKHTE